MKYIILVIVIAALAYVVGGGQVGNSHVRWITRPNGLRYPQAVHFSPAKDGIDWKYPAYRQDPKNWYNQ